MQLASLRNLINMQEAVVFSLIPLVRGLIPVRPAAASPHRFPFTSNMAEKAFHNDARRVESTAL